MAVPIGAAISQVATSPRRTLTLRIDNDAFDFWMAPWNRPDEEYTSGVHISYDGGDAPFWARSKLAGRAPCIVGTMSCRASSYEIGQDIYTPSVSVDSARAAPGARPSGGWLYLREGARALDESRYRELAISLGVTGNPSLARFTQKLAHSAAPEFNRPTDWSRAIGFEPGAIVQYEQRWRSVLSADPSFGIDLIPRASASLGNIRTSATAGIQLRGGWHLTHPWLPARDDAGIAFMAGAYGDAVARDIFLDGNTFRDGPHVGHRPLVGGGELGVSLRARGFSVGYRAVTESKAWPGGPAWHPWSSLVASYAW
jgi:hypothetical protein